MRPIAAMNWSNVKLILLREVRDQLRDRRTLFMIAVLPLLLYPLLGMSFFQVAQFMREQPTRGAGRRAAEARRVCRRLVDKRPVSLDAVGSRRHRNAAVDCGT